MKKEEFKSLVDKIDLINDRLIFITRNIKKRKHLLLKAIISAVALSFFGWAADVLYQMPSPTQQRIIRQIQGKQGFPRAVVTPLP